MVKDTFIKWCLKQFFNTSAEKILETFGDSDVYLALKSAFKGLEKEETLLFDEYMVNAIAHRDKSFDKKDLESKLTDIFGSNMIPEQEDLFELLLDLWRIKKREIPEEHRGELLNLSEVEISVILNKASRYFHEELSKIKTLFRQTVITRLERINRATGKEGKDSFSGRDKGKLVEKLINKIIEAQENISLQFFYDEVNASPSEIIPIHPLERVTFRMLYSKDWRIKIEEKLNEMRKKLYNLLPHEEASLFANEIKDIDFSLECVKVAARVRSFISSNSAKILKIVNSLLYDESFEAEINTLFEINSLKKLLLEAEKDVNKPYFGKNLKIIGSLGSGKTLFLANIMSPNYFVDRDVIFLFFPIKFNKSKSFGELLKQYIDETTELKWEGFDNLYQFFANALSKTDPNIGSQNIENIKFIIVIDNIHQWVRHDDNVLDEINDLMFKFSRYPNVFWIFTLRSNYYDTVSSNNNYFEKYGSSFDNDRKFPLLNVAGWIDLDDVNYENNVGKKIISSRINIDSEDDEDFLLEKYGSNEKLLRMISNPSIAIILADLSEKVPIKEIVNLNYIQFIEGFWKNRLNLLANLILRKYAQFFVIELSRLLSASFIESMPFTPVINKIRSQSEGKTELQERKNVLKAFESLNFIELLSRDSADYKNPDDLLVLEKLPFWYFYVAKNLFSDLCETTDKSIDFNKSLSQAFSQISDFNHLENIADFYFSMINEESVKKSKTAKFIWYSGLENSWVPDSSIWFAATKSTDYMQKVLLNRSMFNKYNPDSKRNLFSFMYFIALSDSSQINLPVKFSVLRHSFNRIKESYLESYFYYIAEKNLLRIDDNDTLIECLAEMDGCEILEYTDMIGSLAYDVLKNINANNKEQIGLTIIKYLREYCKDAKGKYIKGVWIRYYLREFLIREYCKDLFDKNNVDAYYLLHDLKWFNPRAHGIRNSRIRLELEQEATIEIGSLYRRLYGNEKIEAFHGFLYDLSESPDMFDSIRAVFIITHTLNVDNKFSFKISQELRQILMKILSDDKVRKFILEKKVLIQFLEHNGIRIEKQKKRWQVSTIDT